MSDENGDVEATAKKSGKKPLLFGLALAVLTAGAGFFVAYSGLLDGSGSPAPQAHAGEAPEVAFVPIEPILVSLSPDGKARHLRFRAELDVYPAEKSNVEAVVPRVQDVLNGYLRAIDVADLEEPTSLIRIRAQMLRRIQLVVGEDRVRDLLVTEFVLN